MKNNMLIDFEKFKDKIIIVKQVKSEIGTLKDQRANLKGLGLRGLNSTSELKCTKDVYGMLFKVSHLIEVKIKE